MNPLDSLPLQGVLKEKTRKQQNQPWKQLTNPNKSTSLKPDSPKTETKPVNQQNMCSSRIISIIQPPSRYPFPCCTKNTFSPLASPLKVNWPVQVWSSLTFDLEHQNKPFFLWSFLTLYPLSTVGFIGINTKLLSPSFELFEQLGSVPCDLTTLFSTCPKIKWRSKAT